MKIKFLQKEKNLKKKEFSFNMFFYWKIVIFLFLIVLFFSAFFGVYLFWQVNKEVLPSENTEDKKDNLVKEERLEKILNIFSEREKKANEILNSGVNISDPSL